MKIVKIVHFIIDKYQIREKYYAVSDTGHKRLLSGKLRSALFRSGLFDCGYSPSVFQNMIVFERIDK